MSNFDTIKLLYLNFMKMCYKYHYQNLLKVVYYTPQNMLILKILL